jgi:hypothetical protein
MGRATTEMGVHLVADGLGAEQLRRLLHAQGGTLQVQVVKITSGRCTCQACSMHMPHHLSSAQPHGVMDLLSDLISSKLL